MFLNSDKLNYMNIILKRLFDSPSSSSPPAWPARWSRAANPRW